jgi:hypothetical protein
MWGGKPKPTFYQTSSRALLFLTRYLEFEGSVNSMPHLGVSLKENEPDFYDNAQVSGASIEFQEPNSGF